MGFVERLGAGTMTFVRSVERNRQHICDRARLNLSDSPKDARPLVGGQTALVICHSQAVQIALATFGMGRSGPKNGGDCRGS